MTWTSNCNFMYIFCHENYLCTIFCRKYNQRTLFCCKNDSSTLVLLQKQFTHTFLSQKLFTHFFLSQKRIYAPFFCRENDLRAFLSRKRFTHFVWKVFACWILPSGKSILLGLCFKGCPKVSKLLCNWQFQKVELWVKNFAQTGASVGFVQRVSQDLCTGPTLGRGRLVVPDPHRPCGSTWTDC